jgi:catechol 2,3-dioxygenase-like lactoylglutathione lyase family enzyme
MPRPLRLLESALYCDDLAGTAHFYRRLLGAEVLSESDRLVALDAGGGTVLLLFRRGASRDGVDHPAGGIPGHDGAGPLHLAFAVRDEELLSWDERLASLGVPIESRVQWPRGGRSLYFRDPEGHSVELVTRGVWPNF